MKCRIIAKQKAEQRKIANERVIELFRQAELRFKDSPLLANRYVELERKLAMKYKTRIPTQLKRRYCKRCHTYLVPSVNCRVRLQSGKVVYYCINCKNFTRIPYLKEKKLKKKQKIKQ